MNLFFRIFISTLLLGLFISTIFSSFFLKPDALSGFNFSIEASQDTKIETSLDGEDIYIENIGNLETIFSNKQDSFKILDDRGQEFEISEAGKYFSSLRDIGKNYTFYGNGYEILQEGVGEMFIDTQTKKGKIFVFGLNTSVRIKLTNSSREQEYTNIFLAPHMYIEFEPERGKSLKNADVIRVQTVYRLGYIGQTLGEELQEESEKIIHDYLVGNKNFLSNILGYIKKGDREKQELLLQLKQKQTVNIPGYEQIRRYMNLFVNSQKKKVFYKNVILDNFLDLLDATTYNTSDIDRIIQDLKNLQELDEPGYQELSGILEYIRLLLSSSDMEDSIVPRISFANIQGQVHGEETLYYPLYGNILFSRYERYGNFSGQVLHKFLLSFAGETKRTQQYFSYFLQEYLLYLIEAVEKKNEITLIIDILSNYIDLSSYAYDGDTISQVSLLYIYDNILESLDTFLRTQYFEPTRTSGELLQIQQKDKMSSIEISSLKALVDTMFLLYDKNEKSLNLDSSRDREIQKSITQRKQSMGEYFIALENYERYSSQYDVSKRNLLNVDVFGSGDVQLLSEESAKEYILQFSGVSVDTASVKIMDEYYYRFEGVFILGNTFNFDIYPYSGYKIENISIDGKDSNFEYKLSSIQSLWGEKYKVAPKEEKEKYNFNRFFLITFFAKNDSKVEEYINNEKKLSEDKTEIVFKRDKLLGGKGEFSSLKEILSIDYEDIDIEKQGTFYTISISGARAHIPITERGERAIKEGVFSSEYVLNDAEHYFTHASIQIYRDEKIDDNNLQFQGEAIRILGKIKISTLKQTLEDLFTLSPSYAEVYSAIRFHYPDADISMMYTIYNKKTSFKFDSGEKKYTIILADGMLEKVYLGTQKLLLNPTSISNISQYIK